MKSLVIVLVGMLLMGCQTTDTAFKNSDALLPSVVKGIQDKSKEEKSESEAIPVFTAQKPVICTPDAVLTEGIERSKEIPFAKWKSIIEGQNVVMFTNHENKTVSVIEFLNNGVACFISVGKDIYIKEDRPKVGHHIDFRLEN